jgi:hypothetical protein
MKMSRDEFWFWFGVWTSILMLAGAGTVINFSDWFAPDVALKIAKACVALAAVNNVVLTAAKYRGMMDAKIAASLPDPANIVKILIVALALSMFLPSGAAQAQIRQRAATPTPPEIAATDTPTKPCLIPWDPLKLCGALTGKPEEDFQRVVKRIQAVQKADINYAILKAKAANTSASAVRLQCLQAISDANDQFNGEGLKDANGNVIPRPDPAMITGIEDTAELVDNLSPQGKLFTSCAGAAQMFKTNTLAVINAIVTGAAGIAAMPAGL